MYYTIHWSTEIFLMCSFPSFMKNILANTFKKLDKLNKQVNIAKNFKWLFLLVVKHPFTDYIFFFFLLVCIIFL